MKIKETLIFKVLKEIVLFIPHLLLLVCALSAMIYSAIDIEIQNRKDEKKRKQQEQAS
jgi:hypothetical protein